MLKAATPTVNLLKSKIGDTIWVDEWAADIFSVITETNLKITYKASYGYYIVTDNKPCTKNIYGDLDESYVPVRTVTLHHTSWDPYKDKGLVIDVNKSAEILVPLMGPVPVDLYQGFNTVKELCKVNDTRFDCIVCGNRLNMVMHNVRICALCEKKLP